MWVKTTPGENEEDDDVLLNLDRSTRPRTKGHHLNIPQIRETFFIIMKETDSPLWASGKLTDISCRFLRVSTRLQTKHRLLEPISFRPASDNYLCEQRLRNRSHTRSHGLHSTASRIRGQRDTRLRHVHSGTGSERHGPQVQLPVYVERRSGGHAIRKGRG